jgi:ribonuclease G
VKREIVINASALEVRVAVLEDGALTEFFLERGPHRGLAGNIYKGKVTRVLPGMQAAFVDIGLEKAGFLHVSDFYDTAGSMAEVIGEEDVETEPLGETGGAASPEGARKNRTASNDARPDAAAFDESASDDPSAEDALSEGALSDGAAAATEAGPSAEGAAAQGGGRRRGRRRRRRGGAHTHARAHARVQRKGLPIEQQLRRNQEIIVQIAKEPMGTKGARLTSAVSIPGRHLVYMPTSNHLGVSRRIASAEERARLRGAVSELGRVSGGFIVRTACEGVSKREIQRDANFLTRLWASVLRKSESSPSASILYSDLDVALRTVRDLFSSEVERLWCDDPDTYERIVQFVQQYMPRLRSRVALYQGAEPIFDHFQIEPQIERALERKVWLKSGGYLVFDQAEALTAIDVNTGRFVGKTSQDETVLRTNLEAVEEVVKQLRLRNIGGIIIVDFIDMAREADRKKVSDALREALRRDKARTSALKISELGLVQMTRKRTRESLEELLTETCPHCHGRRVVKSVPTLAAEVLRAVHREAGRRAGVDMLVVKLNPDVARYLYDHGARDLEALERRLGLKIVLRSKEGLEPGAFELGQAPAAA